MSYLVLTTCNEDMTGFDNKFPQLGNFNCQPQFGFNGLLWGEGYRRNVLTYNKTGKLKYLVVEVEDYDDCMVHIAFTSGNVVHVGDEKSAMEYIAKHSPEVKTYKDFEKEKHEKQQRRAKERLRLASLKEKEIVNE